MNYFLWRDLGMREYQGLCFIHVFEEFPRLRNTFRGFIVREYALIRMLILYQTLFRYGTLLDFQYTIWVVSILLILSSDNFVFIYKITVKCNF